MNFVCYFIYVFNELLIYILVGSKSILRKNYLIHLANYQFSSLHQVENKYYLIMIINLSNIHLLRFLLHKKHKPY